MISALFSQPNCVASEKLLDATVLRHETIASNLANIETPSYRRLDVEPSFSVELRQAMITMEEASVSFQLMVEVRNKLLESYQALMRMQVRF